MNKEDEKVVFRAAELRNTASRSLRNAHGEALPPGDLRQSLGNAAPR
jgi:hypothetical protein